MSNGVICVGGHIARTVYGDYSDMTIENGEISKNRNDIITAVFSTTGEKGIDKFKIEVKKGTPGVVAEDPELTKENLYEGGKLRELPLWRVKLEGINIIGVEQMFKIIHKIPDLEEMIESLNGKTDLKIIEKHIDTGYLKSGVHFYKRNSFGQIHFSSLQGWSLPYATTKLCDFPDGYRPALRKKGVLYFGAEAVGFVEIRTDGLFATSIKELNSQTSYLNCDISYWIE